MPAAQPKRIVLRAGAATLESDLVLPDEPVGLVILAHAAGRLEPDGRSRSGRSEHVARFLQAHGYATLGVDLLTPSEAVSDLRSNRMPDEHSLAERLSGVVEWIGTHPTTDALRVAVIGWGQVGAAALWTASDLPQAVRCVVLGPGRIELVRPLLHRVHAATLILVGDDDESAVADTRSLAGELFGPHRVVVIRNSSRLFREAGAIDQVANHIRAWFDRHLAIHRHSIVLRHPEAP